MRYEQMDKTKGYVTRMDIVRLPADQGEQRSSDESRVEDPKEGIGSMGGEDASCL